MSVRTVPLRYLVDLNGQVLPETSPPDLQFKYIDISQVNSSGQLSIPDDTTTFASAPSRARRIAAAGDTVVSTVRTYLRAITAVPDVGDRLIFSTGFAVLSPRQIDSRFLAYVCRSEDFVHEVVGRSVGVSYPAIAPADLLGISVRLPSPAEQRRIADFLDDRVPRIDGIIAARREQVAAVRIHTRGRIVAAVFHSDDTMVPAGLLTDIRLGRQRSPTHEFGDHMLPYLRSANIADGEILLADVKTMNFSPAEQRTFSLKSGDVLMTEGSASPDAVGASAVWQAELPGVVCFQNTLLRLRAREVTTQDFVHWWARASHAAGAPRNWASGASILHLGSEGLSRMPMPRVSTAAQSERASRAASAAEDGERFAQGLERAINLLTEYKSSLITAAVTGELDVTTAGSNIPG